MILDVIYNNVVNSQLVISYVNDKGGVDLKHYTVSDQPNQFTKWVYSHNPTEVMQGVVSFDGKPVKLDFASRYNRFDFMQFVNGLPEAEREMLLGFKPIAWYFFDIETEIQDEFPDAENAKTPIVSICVTAMDSKLTSIVLTTDPLHKETAEEATKITVDYIQTNYDKNQEVDVRFVYCASEYELIKIFLQIYKKIPALSGWNIGPGERAYDWPYILNRMKKLGLSMTEASIDGTLDRHGLPNHKLNVDYMELFKKYDFSLKPYESYRLDWVAGKSLKLPKLPYDGTLKQLRENDLARFLAYNAIDTIILALLHRKHNLVSVLNGLSLVTSLPMRDCMGPVNQSEAVLFKYYFKQKGPNGEIVVCPQRENRPTKYKYDGGYVKDPARQIAKYVICLDFSSLYPSLYRTMNQGPTNILFDGRTLTPSEIAQYSSNPDYIISAQGRLYDNRKPSAYKEVQSELYVKRKEYQGDQFFYLNQIHFPVQQEEKRRGLVDSI
ncbi:DNA polymerase II [Chryseobacterium phage MA9V-2]|nr:DNA polymerase II [Chryseobacterium phage MA9V-2]